MGEEQVARVGVRKIGRWTTCPWVWLGVALLQVGWIVGPIQLFGSWMHSTVLVGGALLLALCAFSVERSLLALLFLMMVLPREALWKVALSSQIRFEEVVFLMVWVFFGVDLVFRHGFWVTRSRMDVPLIAFLLVVMAAVVIGVTRLYPPNAIAEDSRYVFYYAAYIVVLNAFDDERWLDRFLYVIVAGTVVVAVEYMLDFVGVIHLSPRETFFRVARAQGVLFPIALLFILSYGIYEQRGVKRLGLLLASLPISVAFLITLGRGLWIGTGVGLLVMVALWLIRSGWSKGRLARSLGVLIGVILVAAVGVYGLQRITGTRILWNLTRRLSQIVAYQEDPHVIGRLYAYQEAYEHFRMHPVFGTGHGLMIITYPTMLYGAMYTSDIDSLYLTLLTKMGVIGLLVFGWFMIALLREPWTLFFRSTERRDQAFALGTLSALVALLVLGVSDATLITGRFILVFGIAVGLVMMRIRQISH